MTKVKTKPRPLAPAKPAPNVIEVQVEPLPDRPVPRVD